MAPILLLTFNRPAQTMQVLERILAAKPEKLYISQDGPPLQGKESWQKLRILLQQIQFDGELILWFSNTHLGCKKAVSSAITAFFEKEEKGIILEDDTLPSPNFFRFCDELLTKFEQNPTIGMVSGNNKKGFLENGCSYETVPYCNAWGWATWKRAWQLYDIEMKYWPELGRSNPFNLAHQNLSQHKFSQYQQTKDGKIDTWDYQWEGSMLFHGLACIVPARNMIQNIGFGEDATHTFVENQTDYNFLNRSVDFPLIHPL
jgi:hypothetical protein